MTTSTSLPQLVMPLELPWMLSTSVADFRVAWHENGDAVVLADAYLGEHCGDEFRRVRIDFRAAVLVLTCGWYEDYGDIANGDYCWSAVPNSEYSPATIDDELASFAARWKEAGICPDSNLYVIQNSKLIARFPVASTHFLLMGPESYIEIVAQSFDWSWFAEAPAAAGPKGKAHPSDRTD